MASETPKDGRCGARLRPPRDPVTGEKILDAPTRYCTRLPIRGRNRCRLHGGLSLRGVNHPNYQGRGYSRDLPAALLDKYNDSMNDPDQSSVRPELALLDSEIHDLVRRKHEGETQERMSLLRSLAGQLMNEARQIEGGVGNDTHLLHTIELAERIKDESQSSLSSLTMLSLLAELLEERRKMADTERKRQDLVSKVMTAEQAGAFVAAYMKAVR